MRSRHTKGARPMKKIAAAIFALGICVGGAGANASIVVGPGFGTPCAQGGCPLFNGSVNAIANFSLYNINLMTGTSTPFGPNDLIDVDFTSLPVGTFVVAFGFPSLSVTDTPFAEAGVSGVAAAVPEPTSLALLAVAIAGL